MKKILPVVIGVALLVGMGSFYGGMAYANAKSPMRAFQRGQGGMMGGDARRGGNQAFRIQGGMMGGFVAGEVLSNDGKTLTLKMRDGSSKLVLIGESTEVSLFVAGKPADIEVGKNVSVQGNANTDGSVTAQSIQLRPASAPLVEAPQNGQPKK